MTAVASKNLVDDLIERYPNIGFHTSETFMWSPSESIIYYDAVCVNQEQGQWSLLHELGHALARHTHFETDLDLIKLEMQAWRFAKQVASSLKMTIDEDHIQNCLDSYRDWLHRRSRCPECSQINPQSESLQYECFNCRTKWKVSASQLCCTRSRA